jgi:hypothetical protein
MLVGAGGYGIEKSVFGAGRTGEYGLKSVLVDAGADGLKSVLVGAGEYGLKSVLVDAGADGLKSVLVGVGGIGFVESVLGTVGNQLEKSISVLCGLTDAGGN